MRRCHLALLFALSCGKDTITVDPGDRAAGGLSPGRAANGGSAGLDPGLAPERATGGNSGGPSAETGQASIAGELRDAGSPPELAARMDAAPLRDCARFLPIPLRAGFSASTGTRLSGDGLWAVANGAESVAYAHRWQQSNSMIVLSPLEGDTRSWVAAVNRDGSVMVGGSGGPAGSHALLWGPDGIPTPLGDLIDASAVDAEGRIVLANDDNGFVRWAAGGAERLGGMSAVNAMSADGRSLAGAQSGDASVADRAVLDAGEGLIFVGLPDELSSRATLISADGQVVVGTSIDGGAQVRAFRWQAGASELLEGLSEPLDINADGSVVVGAALSDPCGAGAAVWRQGRGTETLACSLPANLVPAQWQLLRATSVSDDGRVVSGSGVNPEQVLQSWVAILGDACPAP